MAVTLVHVAILRRSTLNDVLFGFANSTTSADLMLKSNGTSWDIFTTLTGTGLKYSAASVLDKLYWVDGKNAMLVTDGTNILASPTDSPIVQHLTVFQDRLVGGGDARDQSEVEGDGGVWPVDSNKDRVLYCEALDPDTW